METREIAQGFVTNFTKDTGIYPTLINAVRNSVLDTVRANAKLFVNIKDESQFFDVIATIIDIVKPGELPMPPDMPVYLKLVYAVFGSTIRHQAMFCIMQMLDQNVLDEVFGKEWFLTLQAEAKKALGK